MISRRYFSRRFPSLSSRSPGISGSWYSSTPAPSSSIATRVDLCERGFATSGDAPSISCLALLAATTTNANLLSGATLSGVMRSLPSKRFQDFCRSLAEATAKAASGHRDRLDFASGALHIVVHHKKIVFRVTLNFLTGPLQAAPDRFFRIMTSRPQSPLQLFLRGRQNENSHRVGQLLFY